MDLYELFLVAVRIHHDQVLLMEGGGIEGLTGPQGGDMEASYWIRKQKHHGSGGRKREEGPCYEFSKPVPRANSARPHHICKQGQSLGIKYSNTRVCGGHRIKPPQERMK